MVSEFIAYRIDPDLCNGYTLCVRSCSVGAISGERKQMHTITSRCAFAVEFATMCVITMQSWSSEEKRYDYIHN
jgi:Na+-translocating ferredoxin:NAD+ oxidoreductase RNF subunit RnfB